MSTYSVQALRFTHLTVTPAIPPLKQVNPHAYSPRSETSRTLRKWSWLHWGLSMFLLATTHKPHHRPQSHEGEGPRQLTHALLMSSEPAAAPLPLERRWRKLWSSAPGAAARGSPFLPRARPALGQLSWAGWGALQPPASSPTLPCRPLAHPEPWLPRMSSLPIS